MMAATASPVENTMLRVIRSAALVLAVAAPAVVAAPPAAGLTQQEIADGWVMLFDGETTFGWKAGGAVEAKDHALTIGGEKAGSITTTGPLGRGRVSVRYRSAGPAGLTVTWGGVPSARESKAADGGTAVVELNTAYQSATPAALAVSTPTGSRAELLRIAYKPDAPDQLFNGRYLTGWTTFSGDPKRSKSQFTVTPAGELHVVNGPGDLQTDRQFADFAFQFECKTNGKELNSGVFFRCVPGQYQNGYEAQIHNGYKDGDRTKPADFGTGAVYRRVPARKVVSDDNEWFTMTVIAVGPHVSTWVNGYQTADWTDGRKPAENPRNGLRTAAGHLSIQGHDPTTDILFRNLRIADYSTPAK